MKNKLWNLKSNKHGSTSPTESVLQKTSIRKQFFQHCAHHSETNPTLSFLDLTLLRFQLLNLFQNATNHARFLIVSILPKQTLLLLFENHILVSRKRFRLSEIIDSGSGFLAYLAMKKTSIATNYN